MTAGLPRITEAPTRACWASSKPARKLAAPWQKWETPIETVASRLRGPARGVPRRGARRGHVLKILEQTAFPGGWTPQKAADGVVTPVEQRASGRGRSELLLEHVVGGGGWGKHAPGGG